MSDYKPPCIMRKYIVNGTLAASYTGGWIHTRDYRVAVFTAQWAGTSTPHGTFSFQGTGEDPTMTTSPTAYTYYVDEGIFLTATLSSGVVAVNSASAGNLSVTFEPTHPWVRMIFTRIDGGAAAALQGQLTLKD